MTEHTLVKDLKLAEEIDKKYVALDQAVQSTARAMVSLEGIDIGQVAAMSYSAGVMVARGEDYMNTDGWDSAKMKGIIMECLEEIKEGLQSCDMAFNAGADPFKLCGAMMRLGIYNEMVKQKKIGEMFGESPRDIPEMEK